MGCGPMETPIFFSLNVIKSSASIIQVEFMHVSRSANREADLEAKHGVDTGTSGPVQLSLNYFPMLFVLCCIMYGWL